MATTVKKKLRDLEPYEREFVAEYRAQLGREMVELQRVQQRVQHLQGVLNNAAIAFAGRKGVDMTTEALYAIDPVEDRKPKLEPLPAPDLEEAPHGA